ncbi:MAG: hypothetical protein K1X31_05955 [Gemmatimonadaceae bacterium]|nr:hypothetical protein [Gemmatimonadaceae bacterium]
MSGAAMFDVRKPIGALFTALGTLLLGYGLLTLGAPGTTPTGIAIVPIWGGVMLAFGLLMLWLSRRHGG